MYIRLNANKALRLIIKLHLYGWSQLNILDNCCNVETNLSIAEYLRLTLSWKGFLSALSPQSCCWCEEVLE